MKNTKIIPSTLLEVDIIMSFLRYMKYTLFTFHTKIAIPHQSKGEGH